MSYQVFISYRRSGGEFLAKIIHDELTRRGIRAFIVFRSLRAGRYDDQLYQRIDECDDFILLLTEHALDRCSTDEDDWLIKEITHALACQKNVIPIITEHFQWPDQLPEPISMLPFFEMVTASSLYLSTMFDDLCSRFLACCRSSRENGDKHHFDEFVIENGILKKYAGTGGAVTVPSNVISIDSKAFQNCNAITSIAIPEGIARIRASAFRECSSLRTVALPSGLRSIGSSAFYRCNELVSINLPDSIGNIGKWAFAECVSLAEIHIPKRLTVLEESVFRECSSLEEVELPRGIRTINDYAFYKCTSLQHIGLPASIQSIGSSCFAHCSALIALLLPDNLQRISYGLCEDCTSLEFVSIPDSVTEIHASAFYNCRRLSLKKLPPHLHTIGRCAFCAVIL